MKKIFGKTVLLLLLSILCLLSTGYWYELFSQSTKPVTDIDVANASFAEKIYIQLDNYAYHNRDTIWFKAIVTDSYLHLPSTKSKVLYVELIDQEEQILDRKTLKLEVGTAHGFFELQPGHPGGKYLIRAYTRWNMNFEDDFIFSAYIDVFDFDLSDIRQKPIRNITQTPLGNGTSQISADIFPGLLDSLRATESILYLDWDGGVDSVAIKKNRNDPIRFKYDLPKTARMVELRLVSANKNYRKSILLKQQDLKVRFFPEGGNLVNGLKSNLGIKALDKNGRGQKISGYILDHLGNRIVEFKTNTLGMGKVAFIPDSSKTYSAIITSEKGNFKTYQLPKIVENGDVLSMSEDDLRVRIKVTSSYRQNDSLFIRIRHRGVPKHTIKTKFQNGTCLHYITKSFLPWGIVEITLLDQDRRPLSERLWFVDNGRQKLTIKALTEFDSYKPREKVRVSLATNSSTLSPTPSSLSVMVVDYNYFQSLNMGRPNILSYLLLQSEIRGNIENPARYFQKDADPRDMDALLLTQGWRRYVYDLERQTHPIAPEKGLSISGRIEGIKNKKHQKNPELILMAFGQPTQVFQPFVEDTGKFNLDLPDSFGSGVPFLAQVRDEKGKDRGLSVHILNKDTPPVHYEHQRNTVPVDSLLEKRMAEAIAVIKESEPFSIPENTIALDEVVLTDYVLTPEREAMQKLHGPPNKVIESRTLPKKMKNWTGFLFDWIHFNLGDEIDIIHRPNIKFANVMGSDFTYVVVDGQVVTNYGLLQNIAVKSIKSVEIIRNTPSAHTSYAPAVFPGVPIIYIKLELPLASVLAIYTHSGSGLADAMEGQKQLFKDILPQYAPVKEFYTPDYSQMEEDTIENTDLRKLLLWRPDIQTNAEGEAGLEFYNGDLLGTKLIIVEGIDADGNLGYEEITYKVVNGESP